MDTQKEGRQMVHERHTSPAVHPGCFQHKMLAQRIEESGVPLSGIGELDWGEPVGNELW